MTDLRPDPVADVRPAEGWLLDTVPGLVAPLTFRLIAGGHSNLTFAVTDGAGRRLVLRRPPYGRVPRGSHDIGREARTVAALNSTGVPVPEVVAVCDDIDVIGAVFAVTGWIDGSVVASPADVHAMLPTPSRRRRAATELVDALARLHQVDPSVLGGSVRTEPYLTRQLRSLTEVWDAVKTRSLPLVEELGRRLADARPEQRHTGIVHSDYRLGNCLLDRSGRLLAVLDWELSTVGDVLADVGFLLNNWELPGDPDDPVWMQPPPTRAGGFPTREELLEQYASATGHDLSAFGYYRAFGAWRMVVIAEGIKRRYSSGAMGHDGVDHAHLERRVRSLADQADRHLRALGA